MHYPQIPKTKISVCIRNKCFPLVGLLSPWLLFFIISSCNPPDELTGDQLTHQIRENGIYTYKNNAYTGRVTFSTAWKEPLGTSQISEKAIETGEMVDGVKVGTWYTWNCYI